MSKTAPKKSSYHHGDLRQSLLDAAGAIVREQGIDGLSLRKLAEQVGVSRMAPYHHFKDKNQLLCAIAEDGFHQLHTLTDAIFGDDSLSKKDRYRRYIYAYIEFATDNPEIYDLMFGRTIWQQNSATDELRETAYASFQSQVKVTRRWQEEGLFPHQENSLRFAQVSWGTLHGIARLVIDGIYADTSHIDEMCECAAHLFLQMDKK